MTSRLIVHMEGLPGDDGEVATRDVYWDLPNSNVLAILLQNLVQALGPADGDLP